MPYRCLHPAPPLALDVGIFERRGLHNSADRDAGIVELLDAENSRLLQHAIRPIPRQLLTNRLERVEHLHLIRDLRHVHHLGGVRIEALERAARRFGIEGARRHLMGVEVVEQRA